MGTVRSPESHETRVLHCIYVFFYLPAPSWLAYEIPSVFLWVSVDADVRKLYHKSLAQIKKKLFITLIGSIYFS
jgi:hypothetical protein